MGNVFDLRGPEFLLFFVVLSAVGFTVASFVRWATRGPGDLPAREPNLSTDAVAVLAGAGSRLADAVVSGMVHKGWLTADAKTRRMMRTGTIDASAGPAERALDQACAGSGLTAVAARRAVRPIADRLVADLRSRELLAPHATRLVGIVAPMAVMLAVLAVGGIKICVGLSRDKPVGILVFLCLIDGVIGGVAFLRPPHRTRRGDAVLAALRRRGEPLRTSARSAGAPLGAADVALAVALFGFASLAGGEAPLREMISVMEPPPSSGGSCSSSSSCGSSCGGGGGCGGCGGGS